jgi:hypothetical protein
MHAHVMSQGNPSDPNSHILIAGEAKVELAWREENDVRTALVNFADDRNTYACSMTRSAKLRANQRSYVTSPRFMELTETCVSRSN